MATKLITASGPTDTFNYSGGESTFAFFGTFSGATITVQASFDSGATFIDLYGPDGTVFEVTENLVQNIKLNGKCIMRFNSSGATNVTVEIR